jgi:hypothetical protein
VVRYRQRMLKQQFAALVYSVDLEHFGRIATDFLGMRFPVNNGFIECMPESLAEQVLIERRVRQDF